MEMLYAVEQGEASAFLFPYPQSGACFFIKTSFVV